LHFLAQIPKPEGIYYVRLYDVIRNVPMMDRHALDLFANGGAPENITGDLVYQEGFGDVQSAFDNELLQSAVEHQSFRLSLEADPILKSLVDVWRDLTRDVWLEVVLETRAQNLPIFKPHQMIQPRKKRLVWWGKMTRNDATGYVDYQKFKRGVVRDPSLRIHIGGLEMTFVHWLHVTFERSAESFLDDLRAPHAGTANTDLTISNLLYKLTCYCSPVPLVAMSDQSLIATDKDDDTNLLSSIAYGNITLSYSITASPLPHTARSLYYLRVPLRRSSQFTALFHKKGDNGDTSHGDNSLYSRWTTLGDAMVTLTREFFLKFDCELPTIEEAFLLWGLPIGFANDKRNRTSHFASAARWLFCELDSFPNGITAVPVEKSVRYTPCALWIKKIKIEVPTAEGLFDTVHEKDTGFSEGKDISYKTLFRFMGQHYVGSTPVDSFRGFELLISDPVAGGGIPYARTAVFGEASYNLWNDAHTARNLDLWGGSRALVEFEHETTGLIPYTDTVRSFGFMNWGDFSMMHYFDASPGLLYQDSEFGRFSIIELKRIPGGNTLIRGIERKVLTPVDIGEPPDIPLPPPPNLPPVIVVPPDVAEPISGVHDLWLVATDPEACIDHVDFLIDGVFKARQKGGNAYWQRFDFWFDSTAFTNGVHTLTVIITDCAGNVITQTYIFLVNN
jgi:hypothetical protein